MISFDDSHEEHFSFVAPIVDSLGTKAVFFIMTVTIDKPGYLNAKQIKALAGNGHLIGCHT